MGKKHQITLESIDPSVTAEDLKKYEEEGEAFGSPLVKSIVNAISRSGGETVERLSFEIDPINSNAPHGLFYEKNGLVPDPLIKRIALTDDLVGSIANVRSNHLSSFGKPLEDRHDTGFRIEVSKDAVKGLTEAQKTDLALRIQKATKLLSTCGFSKNWDDDKKCTLSEFLFKSARNAVLFGRFATEIVWVDDNVGRKKFYSFRASDPGTIYKLKPKNNQAEAIREQAFQMLQELTKKKLVPELYENDEYSYVQWVSGRALQVFTSKEMIVHNCYPVTDIELNGYPITPIDTAISAITTHINITTYNKLYFQNGRASRGMLVINSDDVDPSTLQDLKQQFNAAINSTSNAWRMPVIKVSKDDSIEWTPIDTQQKDAEFQYLSDATARVVMSAFQISPEEIPGYAHLSRATGGQTLSESNNEYKLEAARDVGIRPLISHFQDFLTSRILPLLDEEVAKYCVVKLYGLDSDSEQKEIELIERYLPLYGTWDEVMARTERPLLGKQWGGDFPHNETLQQILNQYFTVGQVKEHFFGHEGAAKDPRWDYLPNPFYFQNLQMIMAQQQMADQKKIAEEQLKMQGDQNNKHQAKDVKDQGGDKEVKKFSSGIDQLLGLLSKSETDLVESKKQLQEHHNQIVEKIMKEWHSESEKALAELADIIDKNK